MKNRASRVSQESLALLVAATLAASVTACGRASRGDCLESDTCAGGEDGGDDGAPLGPSVDATAPPGDGSAKVGVDGAAPDADGDDASAFDARSPDANPCSATQKSCGGVCVDVDDPSYGCGPTSCAPCDLANAQATCSNGACAVAECSPGYQHCTGSTAGCETSVTTPEACGSCTTACTGSAVCAEQDGGAVACSLECPSGQTSCDGSCADLTSNSQHCGQCDVACDQPPSGGTLSCVNSKCVPSCPSTPSTEKLCGDACVDTATSNANCGACNAPCTTPANGASAQCAASQCVVTCQSGYHLCNGACDPNTDLPTEDPCEVTEAFGVFVSATLGTDGPTSGSRTQPFKTIGAGLTAASTSGKRVYVCEDTYREAVKLVDGTDLFGYFTCAGGTWPPGRGGRRSSRRRSPP